jgi:hypothetical protein
MHLDEIFELVPERPWGEQMMETNEGNDAGETIDAPSHRDALAASRTFYRDAADLMIPLVVNSRPFSRALAGRHPCRNREK